MRIRSRTLAALLWLGTGLAVARTPVPRQPAERGPEIVARVNGEPLRQSDLERMRADPLVQSKAQQELGGPEPEPHALERLVMRELIHRRLLLQEAKRRGFDVSSEELDRGVASLRRRFADLSSFGRWMGERGLNEESLFDAVREELLVARTRAALIEAAKVSDARVKEYYEAHRDELKAGEEVRLRLIAVKERAEADAIMAALLKGADFPAMARQRSLGLRASEGGDTGWVSSSRLPSPLRENVRTLKVGAARGPLERGEDLLIVRLDGRRTGRPLTLDEARAEIQPRVLAEEQQEMLMAWLAEQEKRSNIEVFR